MISVLLVLTKIILGFLQWFLDQLWEFCFRGNYFFLKQSLFYFFLMHILINVQLLREFVKPLYLYPNPSLKWLECLPTIPIAVLIRYCIFMFSSILSFFIHLSYDSHQPTQLQCTVMIKKIISQRECIFVIVPLILKWMLRVIYLNQYRKSDFIQ